jgi:hypothetical protein
MATATLRSVQDDRVIRGGMTRVLELPVMPNSVQSTSTRIGTKTCTLHDGRIRMAVTACEAGKHLFH